MYEKVMKIPDELVIKYFTLCTDKHPSEIKEIGKQLSAGVNPRDVKMSLAREICSLYHNSAETANAEAHFISIFQKKTAPTDVQVIEVTPTDNLVTIIAKSGKFASNGEIKRLIASGAVKLNGERIATPDAKIPGGAQLSVGKGLMFQLKRISK